MAVLLFLVYLYCFGHRKKRNLAPRVHENTPFWPQNLKKLLGRGHCPVGRGTPPPHTTHLLAPSARAFGARPCHLPPPNFNPWIRLCQGTGGECTSTFPGTGIRFAGPSRITGTVGLCSRSRSGLKCSTSPAQIHSYQ